MVEVFRTNVQEKETAEYLIQVLQKLFPSAIISFDLEDCDKILRIENSIFNPDNVILIFEKEGLLCEALCD